MYDSSKPCVIKMPTITGNELFVLDNNKVSPLYNESLPSWSFPEGYADVYFETGLWELQEDIRFKKDEPCNEENDEDLATDFANEQTGAITSDGRSSSYYDIDLPDWLISRIFDRYREGRTYIKTEELIEVAFNDDFDAGNAFKSLVRLWGAFNGAGKAGNSVSYEKNKIEYSVGKLEQRYERKEEVTDW